MTLRREGELALTGRVCGHRDFTDTLRTGGATGQHHTREALGRIRLCLKVIKPFPCYEPGAGGISPFQFISTAATHQAICGFWSSVCQLVASDTKIFLGIAGTELPHAAQQCHPQRSAPQRKSSVLPVPCHTDSRPRIYAPCVLGLLKNRNTDPPPRRGLTTERGCLVYPNQLPRR